MLGYIYYVTLFLFKYLDNTSAEQNTKEYCILDTFSPICDKNEIVVLEQAVYGRMKVGKCLKTDYLLGCSVKVLDVLDKMCSGKHSCNIFIPDPTISDMLDCNGLDASSISAYLEASYYCEKVLKPRSDKCRAPEKVTVKKEIQYIASTLSTETSCGLQGSPWILEAQPGQAIKLSIKDFSWKNSSEDHLLQQSCPINYGYVMDMESDDVINICGGTSRDKVLHVSSGHSLQIVLDGNAVARNNFILSFSSLGCPEYKPPSHSWIQKENETLVIGCVTSDKTWKVKCVDNKWLGVVGNCTPPKDPTTIAPKTSSQLIKAEKSLVKVPTVSNNHVIVFTLACLTLLSCCVIIISGVYCIKRYDVKIKKYSSTPPYNTMASFQNGRLTLGRVSTPKFTPGVSTKEKYGTMSPPAYTFTGSKGTQGPEVPPRNTSSYSGNVVSEPSARESGMYENVTDDVESVKYYILENPAESGCDT